MAQSQGQKMEEIQRMSGAQIHISDQGSNAGDRLVTLSGSEESILLAQFLIQSNIDIIVKEEQSQMGSQQQQQHQNNLYPTNQFDPAIMQPNYEKRPNFHQQDMGGGGGNFNNRGR